MPNPADDRPPEIKPLTSLRFVFAVVVFLCHYPGSAKAVFPEGFIGVEFFFILSGFMLSYNYKSKITEKKMPLRGFFLARIARIYPTHLATFLLSAMLLARSSLKDQGAVVLPWLKAFFNITLLQSFIPVSSYYLSFNIISWSISDEVFFYLLFPLLIRVFTKNGLKMKTAAGLLILIAYFTAIRLVPGQYHHALFYISPFTRILDFIWGMGLFHIWRYIKSAGIKTGETFRGKCLSTIIEILPVCLLVIMVMQADKISLTYRLASCYWIPLALLVLCFTQLFGEGIIQKILSSRPFVFLGKTSFAFYMLHYMMLSLVPAAAKRLLKLDLDGMRPAVRFTIIFTAALTAGIICFYCFETPANKFIRGILAKRRGNSGGASRNAA
ncbi:MAG: acyltransferase [Treponema sp.]|jgi:peptidoglycan/LPS O-acetylase OafA/YrhL|nr:acyltransferase [Treponema sp.]